MCKKDYEFINHLFLYCEATRSLWNEIFVWKGIDWVMPKAVVDLLACWKGAKGS